MTCLTLLVQIHVCNCFVASHLFSMNTRTTGRRVAPRAPSSCGFCPKRVQRSRPPTLSRSSATCSPSSATSSSRYPTSPRTLAMSTRAPSRSRTMSGPAAAQKPPASPSHNSGWFGCSTKRFVHLTLRVQYTHRSYVCSTCPTTMYVCTCNQMYFSLHWNAVDSAP